VWNIPTGLLAEPLSEYKSGLSAVMRAELAEELRRAAVLALVNLLRNFEMEFLLLLFVFLGAFQHVWGLVGCRSTRRISTCSDLCLVPPGVEIVYLVGDVLRWPCLPQSVTVRKIADNRE
jgi:hypothetical protein